MTEFLVPENSIYFLTAALLAVGCAGLLLFSLRESGRKRRMLAVGAVPAASMSVCYLFMGLEWLTVTTAGREQSVMRFVGYTAVMLALTYIVKESVEVDRRRVVVLAAILVVTPWMALASWLTEGTVETALAAATILWYLFGAYYLFFPVSPEEINDKGGLLYVRLRSLFVLCWGALILQSAASEQTSGLTDLFVGQTVASYTDVIFLMGIGALVILGKEAFSNELDREEEQGEERRTEFQTTI